MNEAIALLHGVWDLGGCIVHFERDARSSHGGAGGVTLCGVKFVPRVG